ncbi:hypothetical protein AB0K60_32125 [Thermopolyspora sp. NPDC052614]|uniref:hypothetical protein n=1 Tax=Thermopolyspora sp. NPDC052614 TaxID=3155682 RepID=UPI00342BB54F
MNSAFDLTGSSVRQRAGAFVNAIVDLFAGRDAAPHATSPLFTDSLFAPPFPPATVNFAAELRRPPPTNCRCVI